MRRDIFRGVQEERSGGGLLRNSLVLCEDMRLGTRDRFRCGIGGLNLGGALNSVDKVIVGPDRFGNVPVISRDSQEEIPFGLDVEKWLDNRHSVGIHECTRFPFPSRLQLVQFPLLFVDLDE